MKTKMLALMLLAGGTMFGQVSLGIHIGPPPAARVYRSRPASPGPGYMWVDGYQYPVNGRYAWHQGYWTRPPYEGANWVQPRYEGGSFYNGYWNGSRGRSEHDHQWDRDRGHRDYRESDHDRRDHEDHDRH
jgi:hypothetical protein